MGTATWAGDTTLRIDRHLSADQKIFFVSDLHLGDGTPSDAFQGKDDALIEFIDHVRQEGGHLVIVGDAIDFHQAWFLSRVLRAHAKLFGELSSLADTNGVTYIWGNHDSDISFFKDLLRFDVCSTLTIGDDILVQHGYEYDPYIGPYLEESHNVTRVHHLIERLLDSRIRTPMEHFYTLPNRISYWFAHKLILLRDLLTPITPAALQQRLIDFELYWVHAQLGDPQGIFEQIRQALGEGRYRWLVTGHSHLPGVVELHPDRWYVNTGSWTFRSAQYARWDQEQFTVHDWCRDKQYGDRLYQPLIDRRWRHMNLRSWWRANYMGWFRYRVGEVGRVPSFRRATTEVIEPPTEDPDPCE